MAVVENHRAAGVVHAGLGERDDAVGGCLDRRADGRGHVDAVVGPARLAVEDALAAVDAGDAPQRRPGEPALEQRLGPVDRAHLGDQGVLGLDARPLRFRRRDHLARQTVDALDLVATLRDLQPARLLGAVGKAYGERGLGPRLPAEAEQEATGGRHLDLAAVERDLGAGLGRAEDQAALLEMAVEGQPSGPGRRGEQQGKQ